MEISIGIIGLGSMAKAIISPLLKRGEYHPQHVLGIVGRSSSISSALNDLPKEVKVVSSEDSFSREVWKAPLKILAVKPQQLNQIKEPVSSFQSNDQPLKPLLISVLAGITLKSLNKAFPGHTCVRAVPNTPSLVGQGLTGLAWPDDITIDQKEVVRKIFEPISEIYELEEQKLDSFLALTSSGPAYIALVVEAMADGAVAAGLPRYLSNQLAHKTLSGTASLLREKKIHPAQLKDMVASPAGTTISALRHLELAGLRSALIEAVVLAAQKSRLLSEEVST
ncbi:pyrroline-5-carboxylate reductase [Prochlorococcus marinus]|uniref:pyrroline-5-carboxylate reductase n=1 Tax=Prochlorococcus marinus TaxID=1219 RepID=UPI0022B588E5|nr:pyrroline-5-carboxylate reductase [Prochlorococcus marinus]